MIHLSITWSKFVPVLVGGASVYLPDSRTSEVWTNFAHSTSTGHGQV